MRLALVHFSRRKVAGAESYLEGILPALLERGHDLGFWHETDEPEGCPNMDLPLGIARWSVPEMGASRALAELRGWRPDVLFVHSILDPSLEERILALGIPSVFFAHNYYGTCISGKKSFSMPVPRPCARKFGPACLALYFPRRCGGLNPLTMWQAYQDQVRRLALLSRYRRLVVASEHMATEYARHGVEADVAAFWVAENTKTAPFPPLQSADEIHLLFIGRLEDIKGGKLLLNALPMVVGSLQKKVTCHFAGSGSARAVWELQAAKLTAQHPGLNVVFHGWLASEERKELIAQAHLLIVPSVWPEPFGLVGPEAGAAGLPAVAFSVGGIPQWLEDGVNGALANGNPPRADDLAAAIARALANPEHYQRLRQGALVTTRERFSREKHLSALEKILRSAVIYDGSSVAQLTVESTRLGI
jgi:glycosyltransferase involved in cell wall biosynthesis